MRPRSPPPPGDGRRRSPPCARGLAAALVAFAAAGSACKPAGPADGGAPEGLDSGVGATRRAGEIPPPPDVAGPPSTATTSASGLAWIVLRTSTRTSTAGARPEPADVVTIRYAGWTTDGRMLPNSSPSGLPGVFDLTRVTPGWREAITMLRVGEKRRFWMPEALVARPDRPPGPHGTEVYEMELLRIQPVARPIPPPPHVDRPKLPPPPPDVAGPPRGASRTRSGLAYRFLRHGSGSIRPGPRSQVEVHYTGWTTRGKLFDSSILRGQPSRFRLDQVIPGWTEGLQLMVAGDKVRLWVPEDLAYRGQRDAPQGTLVFDVELLGVEP